MSESTPPQPITAEQMKRARELCENATEGPWYIQSRGIGEEHDVEGNGHCDLSGSYRGMFDRKEDAEFTAESRTLLPAAIARIEQLEAEQHARRWRPTTEYPPPDVDVLVWLPVENKGDPQYETMRFKCGLWWSWDSFDGDTGSWQVRIFSGQAMWQPVEIPPASQGPAEVK